jgi:PPP family 3-phenylpropionic acid transporter
VDGFGLWLVLWFVAATAASSIIPLSDALTLRLAHRDGFVFSIPRGVGSLTFIVANVAMGAILRTGQIDAVLAWVVGMSLLLTLAAWLAPAERVHEEGVAPAAPRLAGLGHQLSPGFSRLLLRLFVHHLALSGDFVPEHRAALGVQRGGRGGPDVGAGPLA